MVVFCVFLCIWVFIFCVCWQPVLAQFFLAIKFLVLLWKEKPKNVLVLVEMTLVPVVNSSYGSVMAMCTGLSVYIYAGHATLFFPFGFKALHGDRQTPCRNPMEVPQTGFCCVCTRLCASAYTNLEGLWVKATISKVQSPGIKCPLAAKEGLRFMFRSDNNRWQNITLSLEG